MTIGYFVVSISDAEMLLKIQQTRPKDLNEAKKKQNKKKIIIIIKK